jgi:hypothetical protein
MKSVVELLNELREIGTFAFAQRFRLQTPEAVSATKSDFDNLLRRSVTPGRHFESLEDAYFEYIRSFG